MKQISPTDEEHYKAIRKNVRDFLQVCSVKYDKQGFLLDIAPQVHEGAKAFFSKINIETLDIDPKSGATYIADLCQNNQNKIPNDRFDVVVCTEVLEHTLQPFDAVKEIKRITKKGGIVMFSVPFNFRIHGPLPDCWRFTEHGIRALLSDFKMISLDALEDPNRWLMPIHYTVIAEKI